MRSILKERFVTPKLKVSETGKLKLLIFLSVTLSGLSCFFVFVNILYTRAIVNKPFPSLVQLESGETIKVDFKDPNHRSPEVIQDFVAETLYHLMTMTSYGEGELSALNPSRTKATPIKVKVSNKNGAITQQAWLASEALESKFADTFRAGLAQMTPPDVFTGAEEIILKIDYLREPDPVLDDEGEWTGRWAVDVIANLKVYRLRQGEVESIPFNKRVYVRPIKAPHIHDVEEFGTLAIALNRAQQSGLQIVDIKDLSSGDIF